MLASIALTLLFLCSSVAAQELPWWDRIEREDTTGLLRMCSKRAGTPPAQNQHCSPRPKLCFFGNQMCSGVGPHPETKCFCDGSSGKRTWICEQEACPPTTPPAPPTSATTPAPPSANASKNASTKNAANASTNASTSSTRVPRWDIHLK